MNHHEPANPAAAPRLMHEDSKFHHRRHPHPHKARADLSRFYVVTPVSNAVRFKRRYELYWQFKEMCDQAGVKLITVEQAFGNREFMVTDAGNPFHVQVRSVEELWNKENLQNLGMSRMMQIDPTAREIAFVDADCAPMRTPVDWFEETWHQLQHYEVVQMWEKMLDLDIAFNIIAERASFMHNYFKFGTPHPVVELGKGQDKIDIVEAESYGYHHHHHHHHHRHHHKHHRTFGCPGLAWAWNVDALTKVSGGFTGPLLDVCILGAGDSYMAHGLIGSIKDTYRNEAITSGYANRLLMWQTKCDRYIKRDVGVVGGTVYHYYHGDKVNRKYGTRGAILAKANYDPNMDLKIDGYGQLQLETWDERQIQLRDNIRRYFRERNEDSCDLTTKERN